MKNKFTKLAGIFIVAMLLLAIGPAFAPANDPHNAEAMWVDPSLVAFTTDPTNVTNYAELGDTFSIYVWLNMTQNVFGYQVLLTYDNASLTCLSASFTSGSEHYFDGHDTSTAGPLIDTEPLPRGNVKATESCKGVDYIPGPHDGSLMQITFEIIAVPVKGGSIEDYFELYNAGIGGDTFVQDPNLDDILSDDEAYNGVYKFTWEPPGSVSLGLEHGPYYGAASPADTPPGIWPLYYGPYLPAANCTSSFDVKVYLESLSAAWNLTFVQFTLSYNTTVIDTEEANVTINPLFTGLNTVTVTHGDPDQVNITAQNPSPTPISGKVLVATIRFHIMKQELVPPATVGYYDFSLLTFSDVLLYDHLMEIPQGTHDTGEVRVLAIVALPMPWLEVDPSSLEFGLVGGGAPVVGDEFDVGVKAVNLDENWHVIAFQFRLEFDPDILELVSVTEGPFMLDPTWNLYGTYFSAFEETPTYLIPYHNVAIGDILYPNTTSGEWDQDYFPAAPGPNVTSSADPLMATIRFKIIDQDVACPPEDIITNLNIRYFWPPTDTHWLDKDGKFVPTEMANIVNCTVTIHGTFTGVGRVIDLYGGASNAGLGAIPFPAPYGGQGSDKPMDLVIPQSEVHFFAYVTYNNWPVQSKDVGFEIEGPFVKDGEGGLIPKDPGYQIWAKLVARTDDNGVATLVFRMPWPCENPEDITGIWLVTATVNVADEIIIDTMAFYYEYLVHIDKVTTDSYYYLHEESVEVCVTYMTHAMQNYSALFAIVITDELGVPFGMDASTELTVGGAEFCEWVIDEFCVEIFIPKWAFTGLGYVHVSVYDKDPTEGGFAFGPEYTPLPEIYILPSSTPLSVFIDPASAVMNITANETATFTAIASGGWGGYTYQWYTDGYLQSTTLDSLTIVSWSAGIHEIKVVVTDSLGHTAEAIATLEVVV